MFILFDLFFSDRIGTLIKMLDKIYKIQTQNIQNKRRRIKIAELQN